MSNSFITEQAITGMAKGTEAAAKSNFLENYGHIVGIILSIIWSVVIFLSSKELISNKNHNKYYWAGPIIFALITIGSNAYYLKKINEKDDNNKKVIRLIYSNILLTPIYLTILILFGIIAFSQGH